MKPQNILNLFKVVDVSKKNQTTISYYPNKEEAKKHRNELNSTFLSSTTSSTILPPYKVGRGPDHFLGESFPMKENPPKKSKETDSSIINTFKKRNKGKKYE